MKTKKRKTRSLSIYTDGGCEPNPGHGAWAFICSDPYVEESGFEYWTTNNRMEIVAVLKAIEFAVITDTQKVKIYTDSKYVVNSYNFWMDRWAQNNWKDKKNVDLFKQLFKYKHQNTPVIEVVWVHGHNGNEFNEAADLLVRSKYRNIFHAEMTY